MDSLISFDALGDVISKLIDKLSSAIGWIVNRETPEKAAVDTYIEEIKASDYDSLTKAALISNAKKTIKEYSNQVDILEIAAGKLHADAKPEGLDDDWLAQFMDKARLVSSEEFRLIWGSILARECNAPGSIPRSLLHTLENMDRESADSFMTLCRLSIELEGDHAPIIIASRLNEYKEFGLNLDRLIDLKALGLIEMDLDLLEASFYMLEAENDSPKVVYHDVEYEPGQKTVKVGCVLFTRTGEALIRSLTVEKMEGFWEKYCLPFLQKG